MMVKHQHTGGRKNEQNEPSLQRAPAIFEEWLHYHLVREKPIKMVMLNSSEKREEKRVVKLKHSVSSTFIPLLFSLFFLTPSFETDHGPCHPLATHLPSSSQPVYESTCRYLQDVQRPDDLLR